MSRSKGYLVAILAIILISGVFSTLGCTNVFRGGRGTAQEPPPLYYDFEDVLVPGELKLIRSRSFICHSESLTSGTLIFKGRVVGSSVVSFFTNSMVKDNWRHKGTLKYYGKCTLLFEKEDKACLVHVDEGRFKTEVRISVIPVTSSGV